MGLHKMDLEPKFPKADLANHRDHLWNTHGVPYIQNGARKFECLICLGPEVLRCAAPAPGACLQRVSADDPACVLLSTRVCAHLVDK